MVKVYSGRLRLRDTVCSLIFMKILPSFKFFVQDRDMHAFNFTAKKFVIACNSCAGWVGGAGNLIAVPAAAVNRPRTSTDFSVSYFLLEEHLTVYYTVFEFYEDRCRAARRVFAERTYRF